MRIPEIQERLIEKSQRYNDPELARLASELGRRSNAGRTPVKSARITPALKQKIRDYKSRNPDASQFEIAAVFNVNQGRVSEALYGKRQ
ncbi:hypothetical protein [Brucella intermedia]|uniref:Uncharacterized protein n=1 Tax=Brucella intermedia M86 TaxID=1234597 RepID=M5JSK1_9HYPH|nr:hypothetical protein [Brucella intermedia]ELT50978.1 hypothetical protein D584_01253 [Brucella intermedia M86]